MIQAPPRLRPRAELNTTLEAAAALAATKAELARALGVSRTTAYRLLASQKGAAKGPSESLDIPAVPVMAMGRP